MPGAQTHRKDAPVFHLDLDYGSERGAFPPTVRDVELRNFRGEDVGSLLVLDIPKDAEGNYLFGLDYPEYDAIVRNAESDSTRKELAAARKKLMSQK